MSRPRKPRHAAARARTPPAADPLAHAGRLHNAGDLPGAAAIYRELLARDPRHHRALFLLGLIEQQRGHAGAAREHFERALALQEDVADYHLWLARALHAAGDRPGALEHACRCQQLDPSLTAAVLLHAQLRVEQGERELARQLLTAAAARGGDARVLTNLGELYIELGDPAAARAALERALTLDARCGSAWINLGVALRAQQHDAAAILALEQALQLEPDDPAAHFNLAAVLGAGEALERAITHARRATQLCPQRGEYQTALAGLLCQVGELEEGERLYRSGLELRPDAQEHSSLLALLQYLPGSGAARLAEARRWAALHTRAEPVPVPRRSGSGPLRVGYVSADFRQHSVSYFFEPLVAAYEPDQVQVTCYVNGRERDAVTERIARHAAMRGIADLSDAEVAAQIRQDGIDVLVDLSGHTLGRRLGVFAQGCAPLQLAYLGYPGTTGVPAIGWRITDAVIDPAPLADACYSERLHRLPRVFCCFQPPQAAPEVSPLPALRAAGFTFGSLNNYMKLTDPVVRLWSRLLCELPESRLMLQSRLFSDAASCERVRRRFAAHGVAPGRLLLHGQLPLAEHLRLYQQIDVALDPWPWNGHTTSCLALHMGVPVIALAGEAGAARMGKSVLEAAGLADWVAPDEPAYLAMALRWAERLPELAALRGELRGQLARSPLCDAPAMASAMQDAHRALL